MLSNHYQSNQLIPILKSLFAKNSTGILSLKTKVSSWKQQRSCFIVLHQGTIVFGNSKLFTNHQLCKTLGKKLKRDNFDAALSVAKDRITNPQSFRELLDLLIKMKVFTWDEVETWIANQTIINLEQFISVAGESQWQESNDNDFEFFLGEDRHGLNWSTIERKLSQRQQQWDVFLPGIPSMDAVPVVTSKQLEKIDDARVEKHLANLIYNKKTLLDIADAMGKDPLKVAKIYFSWVENGWVSFEAASQSQDLPIVLSLDDSPIIQTMIKRALQNNYNVLLSQNAEEALAILNQNKVRLLLLDLTLPDMDGLEFCKRVRKVPQLADLPVVMVTGRDGLVDRAKGRFAGTTKYLTKPFKPQELLKVVHECI